MATLVMRDDVQGRQPQAQNHAAMTERPTGRTQLYPSRGRLRHRSAMRTQQLEDHNRTLGQQRRLLHYLLLRYRVWTLGALPVTLQELAGLLILYLPGQMHNRLGLDSRNEVRTANLTTIILVGTTLAATPRLATDDWTGPEITSVTHSKTDAIYLQAVHLAVEHLSVVIPAGEVETFGMDAILEIIQMSDRCDHHLEIRVVGRHLIIRESRAILETCETLEI